MSGKKLIDQWIDREGEAQCTKAQGERRSLRRVATVYDARTSKPEKKE